MGKHIKHISSRVTELNSVRAVPEIQIAVRPVVGTPQYAPAPCKGWLQRLELCSWNGTFGCYAICIRRNCPNAEVRRGARSSHSNPPSTSSFVLSTWVLDKQLGRIQYSSP